MTTTPAAPITEPSPQNWAVRFGWGRLLACCAITSLAASILLQVAGQFIGFPSLVIVDAAMIIGLVLLRRQGRAGIVVLGVAGLLNLVHTPIFLVLLAVPSAPGAFLTTLATGIASAMSVPVAVMAWRRRSSPTPSRLPGWLAAGSAVALAVTAAVSLTLYLTRTDETPQAGDLTLTADDHAVQPHALTSSPGELTIAFTNDEPAFPVYFDIDTLDVHLQLPPNTTRRVTLNVGQGTHRIYSHFIDDEATSSTLTIE